MKSIIARRLGHSFDVLVDDNDFDLVLKTSWHVDKMGYARGKIKGKKIFMHRLIMKASDPTVYVDHINGNPLDNRKQNLRLASNSQNQANRQKHKNHSSKYRGVTFNRKSNKWQAGIKVNGKSIHLGLHIIEEDAAEAYRKAAEFYFGDYSEHSRAA